MANGHGGARRINFIKDQSGEITGCEIEAADRPSSHLSEPQFLKVTNTKSSGMVCGGGAVIRQVAGNERGGNRFSSNG